MHFVVTLKTGGHAMATLANEYSLVVASAAHNYTIRFSKSLLLTT